MPSSELLEVIDIILTWQFVKGLKAKGYIILFGPLETKQLGRQSIKGTEIWIHRKETII